MSRVPARRDGSRPGGDRRGAAAAVGAAGPRRLLEALRTVVPAARARGRRRARSRSSGSPPPSPPAPRCRCWPTARRCATSFPDRPHAYVKLWKHHAAQRHADRINAVAEERGEPWLARYGGRISSEWAVRQGAAGARRGPGALRAHGPLDRGRRLDRLAAVRARDAQRLHGRLQGHPPGRGAIRPRTTCASSTSASADFVAAKLAHPLSPLGARAGELTAQAADWTGLRAGDRGGRRQRRRARDRARRARRRPRPAADDHGHLHVPRDERRAARRRPRHVRRGARRHRRRACTATRPARPASGTSSAGSSRRPSRPATTRRRARAASTCTPTCPSSRARRRSARTGCSRWTGTTATAPCSSTTGSAVCSSASRSPPAPRTSTGR